jgi:hypothetical protein
MTVGWLGVRRFCEGRRHLAGGQDIVSAAFVAPPRSLSGLRGGPSRID